jgi:hypothetical protein
MATQKDINEYCPACRKYQYALSESLEMLRKGDYQGLGKNIDVLEKMVEESARISHEAKEYVDSIGLCVNCHNLSLYYWDKIDMLHVQESCLKEFLKDRDERAVRKILQKIYSTENHEDLDFDDIVSLGEELEKTAGT